MNSSRGNQKGYIAIITALILTAIIATVTFVLASSSLLGRFNTLLFHEKRTSRFLAESCLEVARSKLTQSSSYTGNETVTLGNSTCAIGSISSTASEKVIPASAVAGNAKTVLKLTVKSGSLEKVRLEELVQ